MKLIELLDVVDNDDNVISYIARSEMGNIKNIRGINGFIFKDDKIWVPRRTKTKKIFPDSLDFSFGGYVQKGETYLEGFERELFEETNLKLSELKYIEKVYLTPYTDNVSCFMKIYFVYYEDDIEYNKNDFSGFEYLSPKELENRILNGEKSKDDLIKVLRRCFNEQL